MYILNTLLYDIDIFGTFMQMSIGKREKLSTFVGGLITIFVGIFLLCLFFFLGNDFLNKTNPRTSSSMYESSNFSMVNMSENNLTIAIKIKHSISENDIFGDIVYYDYKYVKKYYNKTAGESQYFLESDYVDSNYFRCSESFIKKYNLPTGTYLCLFFFNHHLFGGDASSQEYEMYQLDLGRCNECLYPAWADHCNPLSFYRGNATSTILYQAQIFYPTLLYNPNDYENPITIVYKSDSSVIDVNLPKKYTFFYTKTMFDDDRGWMFENKKQNTYWTIDEYNVQYYYNSDEYLQEPFSSPLLLSISLQMNRKVVFYQRSYLKLPEVLSSCFSIIKIIICVVQCAFLLGINPYIKKYTLLNLFYDLNKRTNTPNQNKQTGNLISNLGSSNRSYSNNYLKSPVTANFLKSPNLSTTIGTPKIVKEKNKKDPEKLTFKEYMLFSMNSAICKANKKKDKYKHLITAEQTVSNYYDYEYYTKIIYELQIVKKYIFKDEPYLNLLTNYYKKANLWNIQENKQLYEFNPHSHDCIDELNKIKENFNTEAFIDSLKKNDYYLFNILRDDVKASIMNVSNCNKKSSIIN